MTVVDVCSIAILHHTIAHCDIMMHPQVVLPEGMAAEHVQSAAGLQILSADLMVSERTVEQVNQQTPM